MSKKETMDFQTSSKTTLSLMLKPFLKNKWRKKKEQASNNHLCNHLYHSRRKKIQTEGNFPKHLSHHKINLSKTGIPIFSMAIVLLVWILDIKPWCVKNMEGIHIEIKCFTLETTKEKPKIWGGTITDFLLYKTRT